MREGFRLALTVMLIISLLVLPAFTYAFDADPSTNANVNVRVGKAVAIKLNPTAYTISIDPASIPPGGTKEFFSNPGKLYVMCNYKAHIVIKSDARVPRELTGRLLLYVGNTPYNPSGWQRGVTGPGVFTFDIKFSIKADWKLEAGTYSASIAFTVIAG